MKEDGLVKIMKQTQRHQLRGEIIAVLCRSYGNENSWTDLRSLTKFARSDDPLEPEVRYLKELGYIREISDPMGERLFQATARGYDIWCGDEVHPAISLPGSVE